MPTIAKNYLSVLSKINLMVVNGDDKVASMLRDVLLNMGFGTVTTATDGYEAIQMMRQVDLDLIITDWEIEVKDRADQEYDEFSDIITPTDIWSPIPPKNGASFVQYLRSSRHSPNQYIPVIMLTSEAQRNRIQYARDAGVNEIMLKPVSAETLCFHIVQVIDHPREFITSKNYRGPCRRRMNQPAPGRLERRKKDIKIIRHLEST